MNPIIKVLVFNLSSYFCSILLPVQFQSIHFKKTPIIIDFFWRNISEEQKEADNIVFKSKLKRIVLIRSADNTSEEMVVEFMVETHWILNQKTTILFGIVTPECRLIQAEQNCSLTVTPYPNRNIFKMFSF